MRFTNISTISSHPDEETIAPASPLEMLLGCHARIRHFVQLSRTLAGAEGAAPLEVAEAATAIFRYFSYALPLHQADESDTLFPRLQNALPQGGLVREAADAMIEQHKAIDELVAELLSICTSLTHHPESLPSLERRFEYVTCALEQVFAAHLRLEETVIFPALSDLLTPAQMDEMAREINQRRRPKLTIHFPQ
jgi:iron-sulfur cluster repair protein YtfE (RIC family)